MNAQQLFLKDGRPAEAWYCSECKVVKKTQSEADQCCKKHDCRICGLPVDTQHGMVHQECRRSEMIERAEKLESWDGWVYLEGFGSEFFENMGALLQESYDSDGELPEYVFICQPVHFSAPGVDRIIEWACDDHYDSASDSIQGEKQLAEALKDFEDINCHIISYEPDFTKMVRVREA